LDIYQLELFLAVMNSPSMTQAAERIFLTPGAVSLQLRKLADELHTELFVRNGKRLVPSPAGLRLAEHAKTMVRLKDQIRLEFENDVAKDTHPFNFATGVTTLIYQLGKPLRQLRKQYSNAEIRVTVTVTEEAIAGLHARRFDLGLVSLPVSEENLTIMPLFEEELLLLRPSARQVHGGPVASIRAAELERSPFILYPRHSVVRVTIDRFLKELGITPHVVMEADDTEAIKRLVESGFGCSILPEHALRQRPRFFRTYRINDRRLTRKLALAIVRTDYPRKLTLSIAESLQKMLAPETQARSPSCLDSHKQQL
jgi:LysR family transcriptional regulator, nitrogen assimilation regulatory protein